MNTMIAKEKPDLLFNNPLKQKVYVFLKTNPGKDFETFQVLMGDQAVSRQHFNEVEQAIKAREERDRAKSVPKDVSSLFLNGLASEKRTPFSDDHFHAADEKDRTLKKSDKKKLNEKAKQYIKDNPDCTYDELTAALGFKELSKPHFFSMKTQLRKKGLIPGESRTRRSGRGPGRPAASAAPLSSASRSVKTIEILESIDAEGFSDELRDHYKSNILPLLQKLMPGMGLHMVFLSDPPTIELRRIPR